MINTLFIAKKTAGKEDQSTELVAGHIIALFHALFLAQCAGASATPVSTYLLLGVDFAINIFFAFNTFRLYKKDKIKECGESLQTLVLNETLEFMVPVMFMICFIAAYFGPNAAVIGTNL